MSIQISASKLDAGYRNKTVIRDFSVSIQQGEFWGIVGPNGSGKTTLMKTLAGVIPPLGGEVSHVPGLSFGYVPQENSLDKIFPLTALEVVLMGRFVSAGIGKRLSKADRQQALACMAQVGVEQLAQRPFRELSGGQKQRTLIARALAFNADVLIFDEPAGGMDLAGEAEMTQLIRDLHVNLKRTVLMITHDLNVIANYAQKMIVLHSGEEGRHETGDTADLLSEEKINQIYGRDVCIQTMHNRVCIFVDPNRDQHG